MNKPDATIEEIIGDPHQLDFDLQSFRKDTQILSSNRANLIDKYPKKWIAIYQGKVQANGPSINSVLQAIDKLGLPRENVVVRLIDKNVRRMIL